MNKENRLAEMNAMTKEHITSASHCELEFAQLKFEPMHSAHEGYATLKEEIEELTTEVEVLSEALKELWYYIKKNDPVNTKNVIGIMKERRENLVHEAVQVAAMIERFENDVCGKG